MQKIMRLWVRLCLITKLLWRVTLIKSERINACLVAPGAMLPFQELNNYIGQCGLPESLVELVKIRISQINNCAFCLQLHSTEARAKGEIEQRIYLLTAWRESSLYSASEKAALEWAESLTLVSQLQISDDLFVRTRLHFNDRELADLTALISLVNSWNRFATVFKWPSAKTLD